MNTKLVIALALVLPSCKAKSKDAAKTDDPPKVATPGAPDAGKAAPTAALDAAAAAPASDGGGVAVAVADAGLPAPDAMKAAPAEAGAFYLVNGGPLDSMLVIEELDAKPAGEGGEFWMGTEDDTNHFPFQVAQRITTPADEHTAVVGKRLALWGIDGRKCAGTVKEVVAVGSGAVYGNLGERRKEPAATPDIVAQLVPEARSWYAAAVLTDLDGTCDDAVFAIADTAKPALVKVSAAKDWQDAAEEAYEKTGRVQDANAKHDLEGGPGVKMTSVRRLKAKTGPSLALVYASLNDRRTIGVFSVPGPTFDGAKYFGSVDAEAPSEVVGGDFDGDGLLDVVIDSLSGVATVLGSGQSQTIMGDEIDAAMD